MNLKKILFVIPSLGGGGAEKVLIDLINHLDLEKYKVCLVLFKNRIDYKKEIKVPLEIKCLDMKGVFDFFFLIFRLRKAVHDFQPETVVSLMYPSNIISVLSGLWEDHKCRRILCEHNYPPEYLARTSFGSIKKMFMRLTYKKADAVVAISKTIREVLEKDFHVDREKLYTIHNPISIDEIRRKADAPADHPFFKEDVQVIISVGRLVRFKGYDRLLRVFQSVKKRKRDVCLLILGEGEMRDELLSLREKLHLSDSVDLVGFQSNPYAWISRADVFVSSSDYEGLPVALLESLACGTPVIATLTPSGAKDIIEHNKSGLLVPLEDEETLAGSILNVLEDANLKKRLSLEGKARADDFKLEKILPKYESLL